MRFEVTVVIETRGITDPKKAEERAVEFVDSALDRQFNDDREGIESIGYPTAKVLKP